MRNKILSVLELSQQDSIQKCDKVFRINDIEYELDMIYFNIN